MDTVQAAIQACVTRRPDARIIDREGAMSFREFADLAAACASSLRSKGVKPGDRVAVIAGNSRYSAAAYIGIWRAAAVPVPVNPSLAVPEIAYILAHSGAGAVVADPDKLADAIEAAEKADTAVQAWFVTRNEAVGRAVPIAATSGSAEAAELPEAVDDVAGILYTSGTTGRPKGVVLTHDNILFSVDSWHKATETTESDVILCGLPLFHCYALIVLLVEALITGHDLILEPGFEFPRFLRLIPEHRVTFLPGIPPVYQAIVALDRDPDELDFSSLRCAISAAAPLPPTIKDQARRFLGGPAFHEGYGITECGPPISFGPLGVEDPLGAAGKPTPGVEVKICDADGNDVGRNRTGEICVRSRGVMRGYYRDPDATAAAFFDGGWYRSGDGGYLDDEGYIHITDRIKDMIIVGGENVYPREVEAALLEHQDVAAAAVVGIKSEDTGEAPHAFVVAKPGASLGVLALRRFLRERIAPYKVPRQFEFVDEIPVSASGKILRKNLVRD